MALFRSFWIGAVQRQRQKQHLQQQGKCREQVGVLSRALRYSGGRVTDVVDAGRAAEAAVQLCNNSTSCSECRAPLMRMCSALRAFTRPSSRQHEGVVQGEGVVGPWQPAV